MPKDLPIESATNLPASQAGRSDVAMAGESVPAIIAAAGANAVFAHDEFFFGKLRNQHTRRAYQHAINRFLAWCERDGTELLRITPKLVGQYLDLLPGAPATRKQHLSALRAFFDDLVVRHAVV